MTTIRAYSATAPGEPLKAVEYEAGALGADEVEVAVEYCGICHSDLSVWKNEWGNSIYPLVPGHEVIGRITAVGTHAKKVKVGDRVGIGWNSSSCMCCHQCLSGDQHLCHDALPTMIGHHGGWAERLRCHWAWAIPIPEELDPKTTGPLLCGGITVFAPLAAFDVKPTAHVGVVGIGGLGHMALQFANAWGCEVTAFTSSPGKTDEAHGFGAHNVLSSRDSDSIRSIKGSLDMLLVTVNVPLDWSAYMSTLAPHGRMHVVGAVPEPIPIAAFDLIGGQRSVSGSPTGAPVSMATMLEFAARHDVEPETEQFPMSEVNEALARLESGKARYRIVLKADF